MEPGLNSSSKTRQQGAGVSPVGLGCVHYQFGSFEEIASLSELASDRDLLENLTALGLKFYARSDQELFSLAAESAERTLAEWGGDRVGIDAVVIGTCSFASAGPTYRRGNWVRAASALLESLRLPRAVPIGVFLAECANFATALRVASNMLGCGDAERVLLIMVDKTAAGESRILPPGISVKSDVAASCLLSTEGGAYQVIATHQHIDPKMPGLAPGMNVADYLKPLGEGIRRVSREAQAKAGLNPNQFSQMLTNNYNLSALRLLSSQAGFGMDRLFKDNVERYAHGFAADNLINLKDYTARNNPTAGEHLFLLCSGPNNWGAAVVRKL